MDCMNSYYLYILSSRHHRHVTIGVTADLSHGVTTHRSLINRRLKKTHVLQKLVYVELLNSVDEVVEREISIKRAPRRQINKLVESVNPG